MSAISVPRQHMVARYETRITRAIAFGMFVVIGVATVTVWPISLLGYSLNPDTYHINYIEPHSPAALANLHIDDQVVALYGRPIEAFQHSYAFRFIGKAGERVPIVVQRHGQIVVAAMQIQQPSIELQFTKLAFAILALACWTTGYLLGASRQHNSHGSVFTSLFWLGMSGVYGSLPLALYGAPPLMYIILWLLAAILVPLSIYIHVWFPSHPSRARSTRAWFLVFGTAWICLGVVLSAAQIGGSPATQFRDRLWHVVPLEVISALGIVGWMLRRAYTKSEAARTRRRIRLITNTCLSVALLELLLFVIPRVALGRHLIHPNWGIIAGGAVPLAYLADILSSDLYRLDRAVSRVFLHLLTVTLLTALLVTFTSSLAIDTNLAIFLGGVAFLAAYQQLHTLLRRILQRDFVPVGIYPVVETTITALMRTLDLPTLVATLAQGIRDQFGQPALAIYTGDIDADNTLTLACQERMAHLPSIIPPGGLTNALAKVHRVNDTIALSSYLDYRQLTPNEEQIATDPAVALWCPIVHNQGHLLGLILLGNRSDFDRYRLPDQQSLQRLVDAAGLAFAHSAALAQQRESAQLTRELYQQRLQSREAVARDLAQELHSDVINGVAMINLLDLEKLSQDVPDTELHARIEMIINGQRTLIDMVRSICEQLHPTMIDDPQGLPEAVESLIERKIRRLWDGCCTLIVQGNALLLDAAVQREALRVAEEALTNAVKHAEATTITVTLRYPRALGEQVILDIADNGQTGKIIRRKNRHLGTFTMKEAARALGGEVAFVTEPGQGTRVTLSFPAVYSATRGETENLTSVLVDFRKSAEESPSETIPLSRDAATVLTDGD